MMSTLRIGSRILATAAVLVALAGYVASSALAAEGERALDPRLSLIGGCEEPEALDPIEDPGCPTTPPAGNHPPAGFFSKPVAVATDFHGDIYVASQGKKADGTAGRIDIFSPAGNFISELSVTGPQAMAVDSKGVLYVWLRETGELVRYEPCGTYDPATKQIEYCNPPATIPISGRGGVGTILVAMALNRANDHLFVAFGSSFVEFSSAEKANEELTDTTAKKSPATGNANGLAVDSLHNRIYLQEETDEIGVYELVEGLSTGEEYKWLTTIDAGSSGVPGGHFGGLPSLAVDEGTGDIFVFETEVGHLWELDEEGNYLSTVNFPFQGNRFEGMQIAVDNGLTSPNGKLSEEEGRGRYVYAPLPAKGIGHSLAFYVAEHDPPEVKSVNPASVTENEAGLQAQINPGNLQTTYTFEVEAEGAAGWTKVGEGTLPAGNLDAGVFATASGLTPGMHYSFRVIATNEDGSDEAEGSFATYPSLPAEPSPCPNALLRTGLSALLPDCRAYELVTPADTNGRAPLGAENEGGGWASRQASPAGDKVPFRVEGGSLPGFGGGVGGLKGDPYLATRTSAGWSSAYTGPSGAEAASIAPGTTSPDQGYSFWEAAGEGSAVLSRVTTYVRYPDGHSELVGQGSIATDPEVGGKLISEGGGHIVFTTGTFASTATAIQIEPDAAPDGTPAIYDRTPDGITHVVSLKPEDIPFGAGEQALFKGVSFDGLGVAFEVNKVLYLRYDDEETYEIGDEVEFAGIAEGGGRIFYVENGNLEAFDVATKSVIEFANTVAAVVPATISADGSTAYFVSKSAIPGMANPEGAKPHVGAQNLYRSREGQIAFVGTVTEGDVVGAGATEGERVNGLGFWAGASSSGSFGLVPARSTPDGNVFLFKSRAALTSYDSESHSEIYRYDSGEDELQCLSCNPTGAPAQSDADLQSETREGLEMFTPLTWPENLRADARRAFFETSDPLVAGDVDGMQDVYEWEEQGVGSCTQPGGCLSLISSPQSQRNEYLWAVSRSGDDVFFLSSDLLTGSDADKTPSVYDARVGGGFPEAPPAECQGEGCRPQLTPPPPLSSGDTAVEGPGENVKSRKCGKGKRKVKRAGKVRCVKKKHHRHAKPRHQRAGAGQKGARR
jgi:hypothetical protein